MNPSTKTTTLAGLAGLALAAGSLQAAVIFQDDFGGDSADPLNGTTPVPTTGAAAWVTSSQFNADGSFLGGSGSLGGSATLDFTPSSGEVYTLEARVDVTTAPGWIALGFADGQNVNVNSNARFVNGSTPLGRAWMLMQAAGDAGVFQDGTSTNHVETGTISVTGAIDMRIVLDTTAATWTSTWYGKDATASVYTTIMSTQDVLSQASINSVGFALSGNDVEGTITSFSLSDSSAVPEPSSTALLGLGGLALILRRRK